jgi:hypothetical protein
MRRDFHFAGCTDTDKEGFAAIDVTIGRNLQTATCPKGGISVNWLLTVDRGHYCRIKSHRKK